MQLNTPSTSEKTTSKPWWKNNRFKWIFAVSLFCIISIVAGIIITSRNNEPVEEVKNQPQSSNTSSSTPELTDTQKPKIIDVTLLSFDKDEPDEVRARNRIELITNGLSVSKISQIEDTKSTQTQSQTPATPPSTSGSSLQNTSEIVKIDQVRAAQLVKQNKVDDLAIWYSKSEEYYKPSQNTTMTKSDLYDPSKPHIKETWASANN